MIFFFFLLKVGQCNRSDNECSFILSVIVLCHNHRRYVERHWCEQYSHPNYNHFDWNHMWHVGSDILFLQFIGEYDIGFAVDWWYVLWMRLVSPASEISEIDHFIHSTITKNAALDGTWYYWLLFGCFYIGECLFWVFFEYCQCFLIFCPFETVFRSYGQLARTSFYCKVSDELFINNQAIPLISEIMDESCFTNENTSFVCKLDGKSNVWYVFCLSTRSWHRFNKEFICFYLFLTRWSWFSNFWKFSHKSQLLPCKIDRSPCKILFPPHKFLFFSLSLLISHLQSNFAPWACSPAFILIVFQDKSPLVPLQILIFALKIHIFSGKLPFLPCIFHRIIGKNCADRYKWWNINVDEEARILSKRYVGKRTSIYRIYNVTIDQVDNF